MKPASVQKNKLTRRWAQTVGTRPRAPRDQRTEWAYIFGRRSDRREGERRRAGSCPGATPTPWRRTCIGDQCRMSIPSAHAVLIVDQARLALDAQAERSPTTSPSWRCRRSPESEPGGECLAIHSKRQLVVEPRSSNPTPDIVRAVAAKPGTTSVDQPWKIDVPTACANGRVGF